MLMIGQIAWETKSCGRIFLQLVRHLLSRKEKSFGCPTPKQLRLFILGSLPIFVKNQRPITTSNSLITVWKDQIWTAAVNQSFTDFKFLVKDESIGAHRFILYARSSFFAAMLDSGMIESQSGEMRLVDDDPSTFRHLMKFLYTGMVPLEANRDKLFQMADKYGVEVLTSICDSDDVPELWSNVPCLCSILWSFKKG